MISSSYCISKPLKTAILVVREPGLITRINGSLALLFCSFLINSCHGILLLAILSAGQISVNGSCAGENQPVSGLLSILRALSLIGLLKEQLTKWSLIVLSGYECSRIKIVLLGITSISSSSFNSLCTAASAVSSFPGCYLLGSCNI